MTYPICPKPRSDATSLTRRGLVAAALMFVEAPGWTRVTPCPPEVLFVCPAGTVKSAIARETLRRRAGERGMAVIVHSRGVAPEDHVSPELATRLAADGFDIRREKLAKVTSRDIASADIVVAFDEAADALQLADARRWSTPSWNADYDKAKAALAPQIENLLDELARQLCDAKRESN